MKFYLDASRNIEIEITRGELKPNISISVRRYSKELNPVITKNIEENLRTLVSVSQHYDNFGKYDLFVADQKFAECSFEPDEVEILQTLTSFEVRRLGQARYSGKTFGEGKFERPVIFPRNEETGFKIKTDLHSHLSAVLYGKDLIDIGRRNNITYPAELARKLKLNIDGLIPNEKGKLRFNDILGNDPNNINILTDSLEICPYTNETFSIMEDIYTARAPFTKNKDIVEDMLWKVAERYVENGIEYAELSSTEVIRDVDFLVAIHDVLPKIEKFWEQRGKKIRIGFLAAIARDSINAKKEDEVDALKEVSKSPYIVGCDFLGHESNPTAHIVPQIKEMVQWAAQNDSDFTIRIHAGETDIFSNVEVALETINDVYEEIKGKNPNAKLPPIRIGHAIYKVKTEKVGELARKLGAVFECNATSNYSLNNINDYNSPLKKNLTNGIPTVIGTDGFGLYGTSPMEEVVIAKGRGIRSEDFPLINITEDRIIERSTNRFNKAKEKFERLLQEQMETTYNGSIRNLFNTQYRKGEPQYRGTKRQEIDAENNVKRQRLFEALRGMFDKAGVNVLTKDNYCEFEKKIKGKKPILVVNSALKASNPEAHKCEDEEKKIVDFLIQNVDPNKTFFVIGGLKCGVEEYLVERLKAQKGKHFTLLSFVTVQSLLLKNSGVEPGVITDAVLADNLSNNILGTNFLLPERMGDFLKEYAGTIVASGGSAVVADLLQYAYNKGNINIFLNLLAKGTARNKTRQIDSCFTFETAEQFERIIKEKVPEIFYDKRSESRRGSLEH